MKKDRISYDLTDEKFTQLADGMRAVDAGLDFVINLTTAERIELAKMGDKSIAFVEKALQFANERSELVPPFLDITEFEKDLRLAKKLKELYHLWLSIGEKFSDTYLAAGADAYAAARKFYNYVKAAAVAGAPGSDSIAAELKKRYLQRRQPQPPATEKRKSVK